MARKPTDTAAHDPETGEIAPYASAPTRAGAVAPAVDLTFGQGGVPDGFQVAKYVSVPMLEIPPGRSFICQIMDAAHILEPLPGVKPKFAGDHWATTIRAPNGEVRLFTWNTVFKTEMEKEYPNAAYVGKFFQITKLPMRESKNYHGFAITELTPAA